MNTSEKILNYYEAKITIKNDKFIVFPEGELVSIPDKKEKERVVLGNKSGDNIIVFKDGSVIRADINNKFDKEFKNLKEFVKFLNKDRYSFVGID